MGARTAEWMDMESFLRLSDVTEDGCPLPYDRHDVTAALEMRSLAHVLGTVFRRLHQPRSLRTQWLAWMHAVRTFFVSQFATLASV